MEASTVIFAVDGHGDVDMIPVDLVDEELSPRE
jgi:hypothetical protein